MGAESVNFGYNLLARGNYVIVGLLEDDYLPLPLQALTEKKLMGSYVGSLGDMKELMELVVAGKIEPVAVETRDVSRVNETLKEMKDGDLLGLVALTHD